MFEKEISKLSKEPERKTSELKGLRLKNIINTIPVLFIAFLSLAFLIPILIISDMDDSLALHADGLHTQATIHSNNTIDTNHICKTINYTFRVEGGLSYSGDSKIQKDSIYCNLKNGDSITIIYLPENPTTNEIESQINKTPSAPMFFFMMPLLLIFIISPTLIPDIKRILKNRKIYKKGKWSECEVIYIKENKKTLFPTPHIVSYLLYIEFKTSENIIIETAIEIKNKWLINHLNSGTKLNVVYQQEKPKNALIIEEYIR